MTSEVAAFAATHGESLYRAALLRTGAPAPAQDLVQDTYTRLLPAWRKVEDEEAAARLRGADHDPPVLAATSTPVERRAVS